MESRGLGRCGLDEQQGEAAVKEPWKGNLQHLGGGGFAGSRELAVHHIGGGLLKICL